MLCSFMCLHPTTHVPSSPHLSFDSSEGKTTKSIVILDLLPGCIPLSQGHDVVFIYVPSRSILMRLPPWLSDPTEVPI
jgi:hypothetical protein